MIGIIADDMTGATDVAAALSRAGLRTLLSLDGSAEDASGFDAVIIGLKTRSVPVAEAVAHTLAALNTLQGCGATRFYFKYCSTFDSTPEGNIGPVTEALAEELSVGTVVTTPAAPLHGRTVYRGHLFVGDALLAETHMRDHPVTPMRDSSVVRLLEPQVRGQVELLPLSAVRSGAGRVRDLITTAASSRPLHLVADADSEQDLAVLAEALNDAVLTAGSAGLIGAIARQKHPSGSATAPLPPTGRTALIAGSCSMRTLEQIARFEEAGHPSYRVVANEGDTAHALAAHALEWWDRQADDASALVYSSSPISERTAPDSALSEMYEETAGLVAAGLAERGIRRMLIAGGETSGQVIHALGIRSAEVGAEAALGAPWIKDLERDLHLVLKSGNFGEPELFVEVAEGNSTRSDCTS